MKEFLEKIKEEIKPSEEELSEAFDLYEELKEIIKDSLLIREPFRVELEGSVAKGTALKGDLDLDVFVLIKYKDINREWLLRNFINPLKPALTNRYSVKLRFASHPYLRIARGSIEADIVPAYWAENISEIKTPVDRTPFHTRYVISRLTDEMKDDVRLLKKFFKGIGVYGAEIRTWGFSGYLTELLIIKYGSFTEVLKALKDWSEGILVIIDNIREDPETLKEFFRGNALVVPDPVDPRRNAAAAVSRRSLATAIIAASSFLRRPSRKFFFPLKTSVKVEDLNRWLRGWGRELVLVIYRLRNASPDVMWGELRKACTRLLRFLESVNYPFIDCHIWSDEEKYAVLAVDVADPEKITPYKLMEGPRKLVGINVVRFVEKHLKEEEVGPWVDFEGRLKALKPREVIDLRKHLESNPWLLKFSSGEVVQVTTDLKELLEIINDEEFIQWLAAVMVKRPAWL